jgi:nucleotide-binding universal stress UspA family protein
MTQRTHADTFHVLLGTDGSASARAALRTALVFPWPAGTTLGAVVASPPERIGGQPKYVRIALARHADEVAAKAARRLRRGWPEAVVTRVSARPAAAILREAARVGADVIVVGWRGHGAFRRLLVGSVSRRVVERATCAVLVVRRHVRRVRRLLIGIDGSVNARRAAEFVARLDVSRTRGVVTLVGVVEPVALPTSALLPARIRRTLEQNAAMLTEDLVRRARREAAAAAAVLRRAGWRVRIDVRSGAPLTELLAAVVRARADLFVVGARGTRGVERALLGSVAAGALDRAPVPVLVVR